MKHRKDFLRKIGRRGNTAYQKLEDGQRNQRLRPWYNPFQSCVWTAINPVACVSRDQNPPNKAQDAKNSSGKKEEAPLLRSHQQRLKRKHQITPMAEFCKVACNMSSFEESPIHSYAPRFQGLCPLGHREIIFFKEET